MNFTNVPQQQNLDATLQSFNTYYSAPLEVKATVVDAITGFFTSRGFDSSSAESITVTIISQSKLDGVNPMQVIDTLKGLTNVEINKVIAEIINYNRFKTSFLGYTNQFSAVYEVARNIAA